MNKAYVVLQWNEDHTSEIVGVFSTPELAIDVQRAELYRTIEAYTVDEQVEVTNA